MARVGIARVGIACVGMTRGRAISVKGLVSSVRELQAELYSERSISSYRHDRNERLTVDYELGRDSGSCNRRGWGARKASL